MQKGSGSIKIAIASSGLGHVARGIETWAKISASALHERGEDVTLFSAASEASSPIETCLPCIRRSSPKAAKIQRFLPGFMWRLGLQSDYGVEQATFWWRLWPLLRRGRYDVLHVQDPMLAFWCRIFRRMGLIRTMEILGHGTEESVEFIRKFDRVQHLSPTSRLEYDDCTEPTGEMVSARYPDWTVIPNFVDTDRFHPPADTASSESFRREFGIPPNAKVFGIAAAIKRKHKRIDYLIDEFASFVAAPNCEEKGTDERPFLVIAGATEQGTEELRRMAEEKGNGAIVMIADLPHDRMPEFYRACDVFVLTSLKEMMPIAVLEALSSGLPVIANCHPTLQWMIGDGGATIDMSKPGNLCAFLRDSTSTQWIIRQGQAARQQALDCYSEDAVIGQYTSYYKQIMGVS